MSTHPTAPPIQVPPPPSLLRRALRTLRGLVLWRHERGSWQYDVMVALILLFVLGSSHSWFDDLPVAPLLPEVEILVLEKTPDTTQYRIRAHLLARYGAQPEAAARTVLEKRHGKPFTISRIVPVEDDAGAIVWYDVWIRDARR